MQRFHVETSESEDDYFIITTRLLDEQGNVVGDAALADAYDNLSGVGYSVMIKLSSYTRIPKDMPTFGLVDAIDDTSVYLRADDCTVGVPREYFHEWYEVD